MSYWMTQSLLSNWQHFLDADDLWADKSWASFLSALRREEQPLTEAMKKGIQFEDDINRTVAGEKLDRKDDKRARAVAGLPGYAGEAKRKCQYLASCLSEG